MPKATADDITAQGFRAEQFGNPDNWAAKDGPVWNLLTLIGLRVQDAVGDATYTAAVVDGTTDQQRHFHVLRSAETYLASAELFRRREVFSDSELAVARAAGSVQTIGSRYLTNADQYEARANALLLATFGVKVESESGMAVGVVETGPFEASA